MIGRILQGISLGIDSAVIPIMIKEYTPIVLNGPLGALSNSIVGLGYVFGFLVTLILSQFF
jgi:MFS family permease